MNIYFSCSITGGRDDQRIYKKIVDHLKDRGHVVPTAHLANASMTVDESSMDPTEVYRRDLKWVSECDILIAEVSTPSHGVGYEIAAAIFQGKQVLCCHQKSITVSKIITGNTHENVVVYPYSNEGELLSIIDDFLNVQVEHE